MPNRFQLGVAVFAYCIARDLINRPLRTKYTELYEQYTDLLKRKNALAEEMAYLVHLLNENHIELDEFDLIALPSLTVKES